MSFFEAAFSIVGGIEGKYSDDPHDPGNWTGGKVGVGELKGSMCGISAAAYPAEDIKNLTADQVKLLFKRDRWDYCNCDSMPWEKALVIYDAAVNQGQNYARTLQGDPIEILTQRAIRYAKTGNFDLYAHSWMHRLFEICKTAQRTPS